VSSNPNGQPRPAGRGGTSRPRDTFLHVTAALRLATYDDLLALPDGERGEIVRGSLVLAPAPLPRHSKVQGALRRFIGGAFDDDDGRGGPGGWWVLLEVDVRLGRHDIVRPDLAGWRRERLVDPWDLRPIDVVPDWVCEITSPSNARHDRVTKARLYLEAKVPTLWLIDPDTRVLEALVREGERWVEAGRFSDGDVVRIPPFEAIELEVSRIFPPMPAAPTEPAP
jgi:Uma2 family endonuclease